MALFGQDRPVAGAYELGAVLGDVLTGGPDRRAQDSVPQRLKQNFDAFKAYEDARISRAQANAREGLSADMVRRALGGDEGALGELGAVTMGMSTGQPNFGTFTGGVKDVATMELDRQIAEALASGDTAKARNLSAVKTDKVLPELGEGGKVVFTPLDGSASLTPLGDSDVALDAARADQARASAELRGVQAAAGGWKPGTARNPDPRKEADAQIKAIARDAYYATRAAGEDMEGVTQGDIEHALRTGRSWTSPGGRTYRNDLDGPPAAASADASAPSPNAPPPKVQQELVQEGMKLLEEARAAVRSGADKAKVKERMRSMGYPRLADRL